MEGAGQTAPAVAMCMLLLFINLLVRLGYEAVNRLLLKKETLLIIEKGV